jgi:signal transduction histidine kinase
MRRISGNLIEAQEQERHRIARELDDDINKRLAMLALDLEQMQDSPSESGAACKKCENRRLRFRTTCKPCQGKTPVRFTSSLLI